jgi:hypothetical protein
MDGGLLDDDLRERRRLLLERVLGLDEIGPVLERERDISPG